MIVGHIGCRKGSKGLPGKNTKVLAGKPLSQWSLDQLCNNPSIDLVVVSTDDSEILEIIKTYDVIDIGVRPSHLASDSASKWDVWVHALKSVLAAIGEGVDCFVDLDCTSPLRTEDDISAAITLFKTARPDMVLGCCEARKNPYFNMLEVNKDGALKVCKPQSEVIVSRQSAPRVLEHTGSVYVVDPNYLLTAKSLFEGNVIPFELPPEKSWDIDSALDFMIVEFLMELNNGMR